MSKNIKIGYFVPWNYYPPNKGSSIHAHQVASKLSARGYSLFSIMPDCDHPAVTREPLRKLPKLLSEIDAIYFRTFGSLKAARYSLLKLAARCPLIWELNAPLEEDLTTGVSSDVVRRLHRRNRWLAPLVDACVCNTESLADYAKRAWGITNTIVVPLGSDPELFSPNHRDEEAFPAHKGLFKVIWAGFPTYPWHDMKLMIEVARRLEGEQTGIVFIFTGHKWQFSAFEPLPGNVLLVEPGTYFDMPRLFASADAGLCIYRLESNHIGFYRSPVKLFDFMASGLPVIAAGGSELHGLIRHRETGIVADNDAEQIAREIIGLKQDLPASKRIGSNACAEVTRYYNWERVASAIDDVICQSCEKRWR